MSALLTLGIVFLCGFVTAERIDNASPTDDIRVVTLVDPAPVWDGQTGTWKVPGTDDPIISNEPGASNTGDGLMIRMGGTAQVVFNGDIPEGFGVPLLPPPDEMVLYQEPKAPAAGMIVLNAVNSTAVEVANMGGATDMEGWSITSSHQTIYVFSGAVLEENDKFGDKMNISGEGIIELYDASGNLKDWVNFPGDRTGLVYHRVPDMIGEWQWILGKVIIGSH